MIKIGKESNGIMTKAFRLEGIQPLRIDSVPGREVFSNEAKALKGSMKDELQNDTVFKTWSGYTISDVCETAVSRMK